jgi:hypothetical protein
MKTTILRYGVYSGLTISVLMAGTVPFADQLSHGSGAMLLGYTTMVLSFLLVFFGIRACREQVGGHISFGRAFLVGLAITLISCLFYVLTWEVIYYNFMPDFMDKYAAHMVEKARAAGATAEAIQAQMQEMQRFKEMYANPLFNAAITILEPLPVGLAITLISAAVLRRKPQPA